MKIGTKLCFLWVFAVAGCSVTTENELITNAVDIADLKVEGLVDPIGIHTSVPRFYWQLRSDAYNVHQTAYQIIVASSLDSLNEESADLWNSGKVNSSDNIHISYGGPKLKSKQKCFWQVRVWTNKGRSDWSDVQQFGVGLLHYKDWWGRWIGFDRTFPGEKIEKFPTLAARYFRTEFRTKKEIRKATAFISGLGLYELQINGQKIGDQVLAPVPTDYRKNVMYNSFDVTNYITEDEQNAVGVIVGNGRYFTMRPNYKPYKIKHFGFPKLLFHMEIIYEDGSKEVIYSSNKWKGTADGPIRNNNEYDGEFYDARKELTGWSQTGYNDSRWLNAEYVLEPGGDYQGQMNENMAVMKEVSPVAILSRTGGSYILDMGQNMSGWLEINVSGSRGQKIELKFAESLDENGNLFLTNLRDAQCTDSYILKGDGVETWEPKFTYHGFRYVEITGLSKEPRLRDFVGKMVYDKIETVGQFVTSDSTINQIYQNSWWGMASNYKGMPVDCPQRNERQPWLGDHAVGSHGENFVFDNVRLYKKWLEDMRMAQKADGSIPDVAPAYWNYYSDNMTWPGTMLIITQMLYQQTGEPRVIAENYAAMKKWLSYMKERYMTKDFIVTKDSYGDWCVPPASIEEGRGKNADVKRPSQLISTAYYYYFMGMMSDFASVISMDDDIPYFQELRRNVGAAFNQQFYDVEGYYGDNKMTDNLLPLFFGLVEDQNMQKVFDHLVETIEVQNKGHLSTGLIGTQWLMRTLSDYGRLDLAIKLATNRTYPSWGYMVENGATTIWELWHGNVANPKMNSQNHVMLLGDLILWYYQYLAGIRADEPGFRTIELKPVFPDELDFVDASYESIMGKISSSWQKSKQEIIWKIEVPANTKASVYLPAKATKQISERLSGLNFKSVASDDDKVIYEVGSGKYEFVINR